MANNFRLRNNLGQFIALDDSLSTSRSSVNSSINESLGDLDNEIDPIENFDDLDLNGV